MTLLDSESSRTVTANKVERLPVSLKQLTREEEVHTSYMCVKTHVTDIYIYILYRGQDHARWVSSMAKKQVSLVLI